MKVENLDRQLPVISRSPNPTPISFLSQRRKSPNLFDGIVAAAEFSEAWMNLFRIPDIFNVKGLMHAAKEDATGYSMLENHRLEAKEQIEDFRKSGEFYKGNTIPKGRVPQTFILIPGFGRGNETIRETGKWLERAGGHNVIYPLPNLSLNLGRMETIDSVRDAILSTGGNARILGHSLGGTVGFLVAAELNELFKAGKLDGMDNPPVSDLYLLAAPISGTDPFERTLMHSERLAYGTYQALANTDPRIEEFRALKRHFFKPIPKNIRARSYFSHEDIVVSHMLSHRDDVIMVETPGAVHEAIQIHRTALQDIGEHAAHTSPRRTQLFAA